MTNERQLEIVEDHVEDAVREERRYSPEEKGVIAAASFTRQPCLPT